MRTQKIALINRLNETLTELYHNASVNYAYDEMSLYTELTGYCADEKFNYFAMDAIEYINELLGLTKKEVYTHTYCKKERQFKLISKLIVEYGKVYSYGRGGKTVAPKDLMDNSRNPSPIQYEYDNINASDATNLILMINAFNDYIKNWCSKDNQKELFSYEIHILKDDLKEELVTIKKRLKEKTCKIVFLIIDKVYYLCYNNLVTF